MTRKAVGLALLAAGFALAQNQPLELNQQGEQEQTGQSIDDRREQSRRGPADDGPSILSRETGWANQGNGKLIGFHLYGQLAGVYDSGLTPAVETGQLGNAAKGLEGSLGVIGSHRWKHGTLSVEYRSKYRDYGGASLFNGTDQFLSAEYTQALGRHLDLDLKQTLGTSTLANGEFAYATAAGTNLLGVPANELFDNRTNYMESSVDLTWNATARLSFGIGGQGFVVRRESPLLADASGYGVRADVAYRLTRHQTMFASYEYAAFDFARTFADAGLRIASLGYSVALNRAWDFSLQAGSIEVAARGLTDVSIDPVIATLTGQTTALVSFSRTYYLPVAEARLMHRWSRSQLTLEYSKSVTPGNGIYFTSRQNSGAVSFSYTGTRGLSMLWNAGYGELSPLGQALGLYTNWQGGARISYPLARNTFLEFEYDYRHYTTEDIGFRKDSSRVSLGFAFSPGETALALW